MTFILWIHNTIRFYGLQRSVKNNILDTITAGIRLSYANNYKSANSVINNIFKRNNTS